MLGRCFVVQPIHPGAVAWLRMRGVETVQASAANIDAVLAEIGECEAVITRDFGFPARAFAAAPRLKIVACHGSGTNSTDKSEAVRRGIVVTRVPDANSRSVAELAVGLMLGAARCIRDADCAVRSGTWEYRYAARGVELHGKTLGLIGFGSIAKHVASIARLGLGMRVMAWSPSVAPEIMEQHGVTCARTVEALLGTVDVISLHRPADARPAFRLDAMALGALRHGVIVVNTGRGAAVDAAALAEALGSGRVAAAGIDVFDPEPVGMGNPLLRAPNVLLSPHIGAATEESLRRMAMTCASQVLDVLEGRAPEHMIVGSA